MNKVNVLLPMKGHSERVPNKNLKNFNRVPLYRAILEILLKSDLVEGIYINTDSIKIIKDVHESYPGVNIIKRPENIQGDDVSMNRIIEYDLNQIDGEHFLQTHSTNPLLTRDTLDKGIEFYFENLDRYDSVFSVTKWQTRFFWEDGKPINHDPSLLIRTQDLTPVFEENSNFYMFSKESFIRADNKRIGLNPAMFEVNKIESIDIDEPEDFQIAEILYKNRTNK